MFQRRPLIPHRIMLLLQPFAIAGIVLLLDYAGWVPLLDSLAAHLVAFFIIAMACHGELSRTRPAPQHLTTFYVSLSFGGMVGGLFSGLLAPYAFSVDRRISDSCGDCRFVPSLRTRGLKTIRAPVVAACPLLLAADQSALLARRYGHWARLAVFTPYRL